MDDMGGMFSFLMPQVNGVVIHMPNMQTKQLTAELNGKGLDIKSNKLYLSEETTEQKR